MELADYAEKFYGIPYKWAGKHPAEGYDCSGFVQEVLASQGIDPKGDQTAHDLYVKFMDEDGFMSPTKIGRNDLLFFGNGTRVTHIAIALNETQMIEAGGGGSRTKTVQDAVRDEAMIRRRLISNRRDLMNVLRFPEQVEMTL